MRVEHHQRQPQPQARRHRCDVDTGGKAQCEARALVERCRRRHGPSELHLPLADHRQLDVNHVHPIPPEFSDPAAPADASQRPQQRQQPLA